MICNVCDTVHRGGEDHEFVMWTPKREVVAALPFPEPEVRAQHIDLALCPRGTRSASKVGIAEGWIVRATYARGTMPDSDGNPAEAYRMVPVENELGQTRRVKEVAGPKVMDSHLLRFQKGRHRAVAVWLDGGFHLAYTWSDTDEVCKVSASDLIDYLKEAAR